MTTEAAKAARDKLVEHLNWVISNINDRAADDQITYMPGSIDKIVRDIHTLNKLADPYQTHKPSLDDPPLYLRQ